MPRLNLRAALARLGVTRWVYSDDEVAELAVRLRQEFARFDVAGPPTIEGDFDTPHRL